MDFNQALQFVFKKEGGFSDDPVDRGGATNFGISSKAHPDVDVKNLTKEKAAEIYKREYWNAIGADTLPDDMKMIAFDTAVHLGVPTAKKMIEASGGNTQAILDQRKARYDSILASDPSQERFRRGWNNRLNELQATLDPKVESAIARQVAGGAGVNTQLQTLINAGHGEEIDYAMSQGFTPQEIVARFAQGAVDQGQAARQRAAQRGFTGNLAQGASNAVGDLARGAGQLASRITGNDERLRQQQLEQQQIDADLDRAATGDTAGGMVGNVGVKAIPSIAASFVPGGLPAQIALQGGAGALSGALEPTTGDGQFGNNVALGGIGGAVGGGIGGAVGAAPKAGLRVAQGALRGGEDAGAMSARAALLAQEGIEPTARLLSPRAAALSRQLEDNIPFTNSFGAGAGADATDAQIARALTRRAGLESDTLDSGFINTAEANNAQLYRDALDGVDIQLSPTIRQKIIDGIEGQIADAPAAIRNEIRARYANELASLKAGGNTVSARTLQAIRSDIGAEGANITLSAPQKRAYGALYGDLSNELKAGLTGTRLEKFETANRNFQHLKPLSKMVAASGDSGSVSPRQILNAIKSGKLRDDFVHGTAPYQDLADALGAAETQGRSVSLGAVPTSAIAGSVLGPAAVAAPAISNTIVRALNNPKLTNFLLGLNPAQRNAVLEALQRTGTIGGAATAGVLTEDQQTELNNALGGYAPTAALAKSRLLS